VGYLQIWKERVLELRSAEALVLNDGHVRQEHLLNMALLELAVVNATLVIRIDEFKIDAFVVG
jgi:hypothetical protein